MFFTIFVVTVLLVAVAEHFVPAALFHIFEPCPFVVVFAFSPHKASVALFAVIVEFTFIVGPIRPHEFAFAMPVVLLPLSFLERPIRPLLTPKPMFHIGFPLSILFSPIGPFEKSFAIKIVI